MSLELLKHMLDTESDIKVSRKKAKTEGISSTNKWGIQKQKKKQKQKEDKRVTEKRKKITKSAIEQHRLLQVDNTRANLQLLAAADALATPDDELVTKLGKGKRSDEPESTVESSVFTDNDFDAFEKEYFFMPKPKESS